MFGGLLRGAPQDKFQLCEMEGKMHAIIDQTSFSDMASALQNDELGAATRLLARILSSGKPVPMNRVRAVCQMTDNAWECAREAILDHFLCKDDMVSHSALEMTQLPRVSQAPKTRAGITGELPTVNPIRAHTVPAYAQREQPEILSIKRTAYLLIIDIYKQSGLDEKTARSVLSKLLQRWPEGDVYNAVSDASRQTFIVDPHAWILGHLKKNSTPTVARGRQQTCPPPMPRPAAGRGIVTPQSSGVSEATADIIRQRNANLKLNLGAPTEGQKV